jgi:hypothetical protein
MMRETDRFSARGDGGANYTVIEYREVLTETPLRGRRAEALGARDYRLSDGRHVNWIDNETFQILDTNEVIRKV